MRKRPALTAIVWIVTLVSVAVAGTIAALFGLMATSMDPSEVIMQGAEPWSNAMIAGAAFVGLLAVALLGLGLWHTARFKVVALGLVLIETGVVVWASAMVYREYF